ncbi:MAG: toxin-antitoxin system HicB family antitoxin [Niveispirillum sp.]|uniref:toxin-antitoxin system HicB family antitoxin n=1 Tax=Niveispirillum sp. TaxID=1917217 RepID=UPI003BA61B46
MIIGNRGWIPKRYGSVAFRIPDEREAAAADQAERAGVGLNAYITAALAGRVAAQAQPEMLFRLKAAGSAKEDFLTVLNKAGRNQPPVAGDELPPKA